MLHKYVPPFSTFSTDATYKLNGSNVMNLYKIAQKFAVDY